MAIEPPEPCPERDRLQEIIGLCRKRFYRAEEKLKAADEECAAALRSLKAAETRLAAWHQANPDPQGSLI